MFSRRRDELARTIIEMLRLPGEFARDRRGTVAIVAAVALPAFIASLALGSEVAYWNAKQAKLAQMTDAIAYSAAIAHLAGEDLTLAEVTAASEAEAAGYDADALTFSVVLDESGSADRIVAEIHEPVERYLSRMFMDEDPVLRARATAQLQDDVDACVLALGLTDTNVSIGGNASINLADCAIASNSSSTQAIKRFGSADLFTECVYTRRGAATSGIGTADTRCGAVDRKTPILKDPLRSVLEPDPDIPACGGTGGSYPQAWTPGLCKTARIDGDVALAAGTYIFDRNLSIHGSLVGVDVTLVFIEGAELHVNAKARVDISAPTDKTDPLAGIAIFGRSGGDPKINGKAETAFDGIVYFPNSTVEMNGTAATASPCTRVIAEELIFSGDYALSTSCDREDFARNGFHVATTARVVE